MMDCKKALEEAGGDMTLAAELLRKRGIAKAEKRSGRDASQGLVAIMTSATQGAMIELDCETDFVARTDGFQMLIDRLVSHALEESSAGVSLETFLDQAIDGKPAAEWIKEASGKTGEAMALKRLARFGSPTAVIGCYRHHNQQVGVLVEIEGAVGDAATTLANEIALHVASADPIAVTAADIPAELLERERRIAEEQVANEGKPEAIRAKIIEGKVRKFAAERALVDQPFVKDESMTIGRMLGTVPGARVVRFARFKVGEV